MKNASSEVIRSVSKDVINITHDDQLQGDISQDPKALLLKNNVKSSTSFSNSVYDFFTKPSLIRNVLFAIIIALVVTALTAVLALSGGAPILMALGSAVGYAIGLSASVGSGLSLAGLFVTSALFFSSIGALFYAINDKNDIDKGTTEKFNPKMGPLLATSEQKSEIKAKPDEGTMYKFISSAKEQDPIYSEFKKRIKDEVPEAKVNAVQKFIKLKYNRLTAILNQSYTTTPEKLTEIKAKFLEKIALNKIIFEEGTENINIKKTYNKLSHLKDDNSMRIFIGDVLNPEKVIAKDKVPSKPIKM